MKAHSERISYASQCVRNESVLEESVKVDRGPWYSRGRLINFKRRDVCVKVHIRIQNRGDQAKPNDWVVGPWVLVYPYSNIFMIATEAKA